jgi:hypothetical protein
MIVKLKRSWYGPNGVRYPVDHNNDTFDNIPEELRDQLPSDAEVLSDKPAAKPKNEDAGKPLKDFDEARKTEDVVAETLKAKGADGEEPLEGEGAEVPSFEPAEPQPEPLPAAIVVKPSRRRK